jgi:hypothetical protein
VKPSAREIAELTWRARELLTLLADPALDAERPALLRQLAPLPGDYARLFTADVAAAARELYEELWRDPPPWPLEAQRGEARVAAATVDDLVRRTARAREFPAAYADVAGALRPGHVWLCWRYVDADGGTVTFDGLVEIDGRLVWCPKPWLVVPVVAIQSMASQWID